MSPSSRPSHPYHPGARAEIDLHVIVPRVIHSPVCISDHTMPVDSWLESLKAQASALSCPLKPCSPALCQVASAKWWQPCGQSPGLFAPSSGSMPPPGCPLGLTASCNSFACQFPIVAMTGYQILSGLKQYKFITSGYGLDVQKLKLSAELCSFWRLLGEKPSPSLLQLPEAACTLLLTAPSSISIAMILIGFPYHLSSLSEPPPSLRMLEINGTQLCNPGLSHLNIFQVTTSVKSLCQVK